MGAQRVIGELRTTGGVESDPAVRSPFLKTIRSAQSILDKFGYGAFGQGLEQALNQGAKKAAPEATGVLGGAIKAMTWQDEQGTLNGLDAVATLHFNCATSKPLARRFAPIVENALVKTDAFQSHDTLIGQCKSVSLALDVKADLPSYVVQRALNALNIYIGKVAASICKKPAAWSMGMLKTVFLGL
ncbi:DUF4197 domain-containing protein [Alphaproteobacteria bacterium]|nr:DUF4197 domain-containing protein [Alphaproteobacteria bacterium]